MKVEWHAPIDEAPPARILFFGRKAGRALLQIRVESTDAAKVVTESAVDVELSHDSLFDRRAMRLGGRVASNGFVAFALAPKDAKDAEQQIQPFDASGLAILRATIRVGDAPPARLTAASWRTRALCIGVYAGGLVALGARAELWVHLVGRGAVPLKLAVVVLSLAFAAATLALLLKPNRLGAFLLRPRLATLAAVGVAIATTSIASSATEVTGVEGTNIELGVHAFGLPVAGPDVARLCGTSIGGLDECECPEDEHRSQLGRSRVTIACKRRWDVPAEARLTGAGNTSRGVCIDKKRFADRNCVVVDPPTATLDEVVLQRHFDRSAPPHTRTTLTFPANADSIVKARSLRVRSSTYVGPAVVESVSDRPSVHSRVEGTIIRGDLEGSLPVSGERHVEIKRNGVSSLVVSCVGVERPVLVLFDRSPSSEMDRTVKAFPTFDIETVGKVAPAFARDGSGLAAVCMDANSKGEDVTIVTPKQPGAIALPFSARAIVVKDASNLVEGTATCSGDGQRNRLRPLTLNDQYRGRVKEIHAKDGGALWTSAAEREGVVPRLCIDAWTANVDVTLQGGKRTPASIVGDEMIIKNEERCVKAAEKQLAQRTLFPCDKCPSGRSTWSETVGDLIVYACKENR